MSEATKPNIEEGIEENMLVSWFETRFGFLKPHYKTIAIVGGLLIVGVILFMFLQKMRSENYAAQWGSFNQAFSNTMMDGKATHLTDLADQFPDAVSSNWAMVIAGDITMREGLGTLATNRESALKKIKKAKSHYQAVVDSKIEKTPMLEERSVFGLAYALESLGKFEEAGDYYEQLIEQTEEDSVFFEAATRGLARTKDPALVNFYASFESKKMGIAPGVRLADRPKIEFIEVDLLEGESAAGPEFLNDSAEPENSTEPPKSNGSPAEKKMPPVEATQPETTQPETESELNLKRLSREPLNRKHRKPERISHQ